MFYAAWTKSSYSPNKFNKRSMLHVENLIDGLFLCCKSDENFKIYNINDNKNYNTYELISKLRLKIHKDKKHYFIIPYFILRLIALTGDALSFFIHVPLNSEKLKKLFGNETYSCDEIIKELGYSPKLYLEDAIDEMIDSYSTFEISK